MDKLIVKIFVNNNSKNELISLVDKMNFENENSFENDIVRNCDFDELKSKEFPDGFLYFPFMIEYYTSNETVRTSDVNNTEVILTELWKNDISAVASCDYEYKLPENGGYNNRNIFWKNKNS